MSATDKNDIPPELKGIKRILRAFTFSWAGFKYMMAEEAFRQEALLTLGGGVALLFMDVAVPMKLAMLASLFMVMMVEALNTGTEKLVDLVTSEYHENAKMAKDMGSLSVLFSLIVAGLIWAAGIYMAIDNGSGAPPSKERFTMEKAK
jgi:diacylglycerol kinase (ATP)